MRRQSWTEEEEKVLKRLWTNPKVSMEDIVRVLNRTEDSIWNKARRLGLKARGSYRKSDIDYEYLKKLLEVVEG